MKKLILFVALLTLTPVVNAAPAVILVVAAGAAYAAGATIATAIAIGMAAASYYLAKNMAVPSAQKSQAQMKQMLRSSRPPKQVVYGRTLISGALIFAEEQVGDVRNDEGTYNEWLYMAVGICNHSIESVHSIYLNETPIGDFGNKVDYVTHNDPTTVDQYLLDNAPSWASDMIGNGTTWFRIGMLFDRELFANGVPTPRLELSGHNTIWDPRDDSESYTNNAALVVLDYFLRYRNLTRDRVITSGFGSFIDAANLCDENITNPDGSTSKRYEVNGVFNMDEKPGQVLDDLLASCGGQLVRIGGKIGLLPAAYYGPATFTITESDIIDDIQIQPEPSYADAINTVKGTFVDPSQNYVETDYPVLIDEAAKLRDGGELATDLNFRFVTDSYQAQRLGDIELRRALTGGAIVIKTNLRGLYARLGRVVNLQLDTIGLVGEYRVVNASNHVMEGVELSLIRDDIDIYDDAVGVPFVPPPLTNLPVGGIAPPTGVQFLVETIGEVVQGQIAWQINAPQSTSTDIRIKEFASGDIVQVGSTTGRSYKVNGLPADNYVVEVRTVDMKGQVSTWASASFVVDVPPDVDTVTTNRSNWNIELIPNITTGIPSGTVFEFWYLADNASYITDPPTYDDSDRNASIKLFTGSSFNHGGLTPDRWGHYWVRSVNPYGESANWLYVQTGTTKEQDLVTTVVERLVAIEVESANWDIPSDTGYKLFSPASPPYQLPNGDWLNNPDGLAVFNHVVARGDIFAETLTFVTPSAIPPEIDNGNTLTTFYQTSAPTVGESKEGDIWFDTDDGNKQYRYNGSTWQSVQDADVIQAIQDAANAQSTADGKITTFYQTSAPTAGESSEGDIWFDTDDGNKQYVYVSGTWVDAQDTDIGQAISDAAGAQATADGKVTTFYQASAPTAEGEGDLWVDIDDGNKLYRWSGSAWVDVQDEGINTALQNAANAQSTADGKIESFFQPTQPATGSEGDIWFDTDDGNKQYVYTSGAWVNAQDTDIGDAILAAQNAQTTADGKVTTFYQTSAPTAGESNEGDLWVDTDDGNKLYRYSGSAWVDVQDEDAKESNQNWADFSVVYPDPSTIQISGGNYQPGVQGWAIDSAGNVEFYNGVFRGTLYSGDIQGDIYKAITVDIPSNFTYTVNSSTNQNFYVFGRVTIPSADLDRVFRIPEFSRSSVPQFCGAAARLKWENDQGQVQYQTLEITASSTLDAVVDVSLPAESVPRNIEFEFQISGALGGSTTSFTLIVPDQIIDCALYKEETVIFAETPPN